MNHLQELNCNESPHYVTPRYPLHVKQKLVCADLYSESPTSYLFVYLFSVLLFCFLSFLGVFFSARSHTTYLHDTKIHGMRELKVSLDIISDSCYKRRKYPM